MVKDSYDRYANTEVSYLLQHLEQYRGLAILTTNLKSDFDPAFTRRFQAVVIFPLPDVDCRIRIWNKMYSKSTSTDELDFKALSRLEISGGSIKNIAINSALQATSAKEPVSMRHAMHAAKHECGKIEKSVNETEFGSWYAAIVDEHKDVTE